jgi:U3 small nucleolar RNA-associated protein 23
MRQKRTKAYKKLMALYSMSFGFRQPYQVLVDSTFCTEVCQHKMDPIKQLSVVLQGDCKISESLSYHFTYFSNFGQIVITQCSMVELYKLGPSAQHIVDMAKGFERRRCNHREAIENEPCVVGVVGMSSRNHYGSDLTNYRRDK